MFGVKFGNKHSWNDFNLILTGKTIGIPIPKIEKIDVFGMDGDLDLTDSLSDVVRYGNRALSFTFEYMGDQETFIDKLEELSNYLHGKKMQIILDSDPTFYYYGRCTINTFNTDKRTCTFQIDVDADPYKMEINEYMRSIVLNGSGSIALENLRKVVIPEIECSQNGITVSCNGKSYSLKQGKQRIYDIQLDENTTKITLNGTGTVTFTYRRGSL